MGDVVLSWQDLAELPRRLNEAQAGFAALRPLVTTPRAAAATGSAPASAAIAAFGGLLVQFLADTARAIDEDVATMRRVTTNYRENDSAIVAWMTGVERPSQTVRVALDVAAATDDVVVPVAVAVTATTDGAQSVLRDGDRALRDASGAVRDLLGDDVGRVVTAPWDVTAAGLRGLDDAAQVIEDGARDAAEAARELAGRADRYLRVERPVGARP